MVEKKLTSRIKDVITDGKSQVKPLTKVIQSKAKLDNPILIAGFPGAGMVGAISTSYVIEKLHMHQIACVESDYIVPGVIYVGGKLRHPFRLYANREGTVCVLGYTITTSIASSIQHLLGELLEDFYRHAYPMALHVKHC